MSAVPTAGAIDETSRRLYRRYAVHSFAIMLFLWVVGYWPTRHLAPGSGMIGMAVGGGLAWLASWIGTLPIHGTRHKPVTDSVSAIMGAVALRSVVATVFGLAAALSGLFDPTPLLLWLGIAHAGLLVADTAFGRAHIQAKSPSAEAQVGR